MIGELDRRLANIVRVGTVATLDDAAARVQIDLGDGLTTDWLPWATARAGGNRSWDAPEVGEQVLLFAPSGDLASAFVMGSVPQDSAPAPASSKDHTRYQWADGAFQDYDRAGHHYVLDIPSAGDLTLRVGAATLKISDAQVRCEINGTILTLSGAGARLIGNAVVDGNLAVSSGASGTFTTPTGNVVTVQDGIVTNIF